MTVRVFGPKSHYPTGFVANVTSRSTDEFGRFSPFLLEPIGGEAKNVENLWQYSKVYACHVDKNNDPLPEYSAWRAEGFAKHYGIRYPMGKGAKPLYSLWHGEKLDYIAARMKIYEPQYRAAAIANCPGEIQLLKNALKKYGEIFLFDFDGYEHLCYDMTLADVGRNAERSMGHAFVIASILTGEVIF